MKKALLPLVFLVFVLSQSTAQDSISSLSFHSEAERTAFEKAANGQPDYLSLFLHSFDAVDESKTARVERQIEQIVEEIRSSGVMEKSTKKQSKEVYEVVHERYFRLYEFENAFVNVFTNGRYNCVSATAIYAMTFEKLGIPYQIVEEPSHVYIIGWPKTDNIVIEGTTPQKGYYKVSGRFKERYVQSLIEGKLIDPGAFLGLSQEQIYDAIMKDERKEIDLWKLVGIQYGNYGAYALEQNDHNSALKNLKKALWFYPKPIYAAMANSARTLYLYSTETLVDDRYTDEMIAWSNDTLNKAQLISIMSCYMRLLETKLYNTRDWSAFERSSQRLLANVKDTSLLSDLGFAYHYEYGRIAYQNAEYAQALVQLDSAFAYQPNNSDLQALFAASMVNVFQGMSSHEEMLSMLETYEARHASMTKDVRLQTLKAELCLRIAYELLLDKNYTKGMLWIDRFETNIENGSTALIDGALIGMVYAEAMGIQFVRGNKSAARALLERGLKYDPTNLELKNRQRMMR